MAGWEPRCCPPFSQPSENPKTHVSKHLGGVYLWPPLQAGHGDDSLPFFQDMTKVLWQSSPLWSQDSFQHLSLQSERSKNKCEKSLMIISEVLKYMRDFDTLSPRALFLALSFLSYAKNNNNKIAYPTPSKSSGFCFFFYAVECRLLGYVVMDSGLGDMRKEGMCLFSAEEEEEQKKGHERQRGMKGSKMPTIRVSIALDADSEQISSPEEAKTLTSSHGSHPALRSVLLGPIRVGLGSPFETEAYVWL